MQLLSWIIDIVYFILDFFKLCMLNEKKKHLILFTEITYVILKT